MSSRTLKLIAGLTLSLVMVVSPALALNEEVIYFADSLDELDGFSALYKVEFDDVNGVANLILLTDGVIPYNNTDAIACEPDGSTLWLIDDMYGAGSDSDTGMFLSYDIETGVLTEVGLLALNGKRMTFMDQASCAPDGTLYICQNGADRLLTVDKATGAATLLGQVYTTDIDPAGVRVNIAGSDITHDIDGNLYLQINSARTGAPKGLYIVDPTPVPSGVVGQSDFIYATLVGTASGAIGRFSGLAVRDRGYGDLVGSVTSGQHVDSIVQVDKTTTSLIAGYPMMLNGVPYLHRWGDMTTGPLGYEEEEDPECTYTIGYWKNHSWNDRVVTILGIVVDEELGKKILKKANSKNMSMFYAQLIAAKLNTNNSPTYPLTSDAEDFLEALSLLTGDILITGPDGQPTIDWDRTWASDEEKASVTEWKTMLDEFNNMYHCEEPLDKIEDEEPEVKTTAAPVSKDKKSKKNKKK